MQVMSYLCFQFSGVIGQRISVAFRLWVWWSTSVPESIEWVIDDQAFSPSYDLAPRPPPPTPSPYPFSKLSLFLSLPICRRRSSLLTGEGGGGERGAKSYDSEHSEKAWSSINNSMLSALSSLSDINWFSVTSVSWFAQRHSDNFGRFLRRLEFA
jgi:hypothetical protein